MNDTGEFLLSEKETEETAAETVNVPVEDTDEVSEERSEEETPSEPDDGEPDDDPDSDFDADELRAMRRNAVVTTPDEPLSPPEPPPSPLLKRLHILTWIFAGFAFLCFGSFLFSQLIQPSEAGTKLLGCAAVLVILIPVLYRRFWKRAFSKWAYRILSACYFLGVTFFCVTFAMLCVRVASYSAQPPENAGDTVIIVYGCRTRNGEPKSMLAERLETAYLLLCENPLAHCVVSGGVDFGETDSEGEIMARYLARKGIDASRITVEGEAQDTKGNIRNSLAVIAENGWENQNVISVSSSFHMPRIEYLCSRYGLECGFAGAPTKDVSVLLPTLTREYMAYVKMVLLLLLSD